APAAAGAAPTAQPPALPVLAAPPGGKGGGLMPGGGPAFPQPGMGGFQEECRLGARLSKPSAVLVHQLDLPRGEGLVVEAVRSGRSAARAGLKAHDILLRLSAKPVPSELQQFDRMLAALKRGKPVDAVVLRRGKKTTVKGLTLPKPAPVNRPGAQPPPRPPHGAGGGPRPPPEARPPRAARAGPPPRPRAPPRGRARAARARHP